MRTTDAGQYLPFLGLKPIQLCECAGPNCNQRFVAENGVAFQGQCDGEIHIYLFHNFACYLETIPPECCGR